MRACVRAIFVAVLLAGVFVASAKADTFYTYVGDKFTNVTGVYSQGDQVTGSFVLSSSYVYPNQGAGIYPVANFVTSYSFTDGHQTLTQSNSTAVIDVGFNPDGTPIVPTNGVGVNSDWFVQIFTPTSEISTESVNHGDYQTYALSGNSSAEILSSNGNLYPGGPGTWTLHVPEGGTTALFLLAGLTLLAPFIGLKRVTRGL